MSDTNIPLTGGESATQEASASTESQESNENQENSEEVVEAASEEESNSNPKTYKVKIDGEEVEMTEEEILKHAQMGKAAHKRMQESAQLKKDVENFFKALTSDTKATLRELGIDPKKFAEQVINEELAEMEKSPEQKEREKMQKELEKIRKELESEKEAKRNAELSQIQKDFEMELERDITDSLANSTLPKSPYVIKRIADSMLLAMQNGYSDIGVKDVIPMVEKQINEELQEMFGFMAEDTLEKVLGKQNLERWRKSKLKKVRQPVEAAKDIKSTGEALKGKQAEQPKKITMKDFLRGIGN